MLPELLAQLSPGVTIASVTGDWAYETKACHAAILANLIDMLPSFRFEQRCSTALPNSEPR